MGNIMERDSFGEFKQLFLKMVDDVEKLRDEQVNMKISQAVLKVKIAFWGAVGATIATGLFNLIVWLMRDVLKGKI